jgi:hypothetical protein
MTRRYRARPGHLSWGNRWRKEDRELGNAYIGARPLRPSQESEFSVPASESAHEHRKTAAKNRGQEGYPSPAETLSGPPPADSVP